MTDRAELGNSLTLKAQLYGYDALGQKKVYWSGEKAIPYKAYIQQSLDPLTLKMPNEKAVAILALTLQDALGNPVHHNVMTFVVEAPTPTEMTLLNGKNKCDLRILFLRVKRSTTCFRNFRKRKIILPL